MNQSKKAHKLVLNSIVNMQIDKVIETFVCVFFFFSYSSSFPIKMFATNAKMQKNKPYPNFYILFSFLHIFSLGRNPAGAPFRHATCIVRQCHPNICMWPFRPPHKQILEGHCRQIHVRSPWSQSPQCLSSSGTRPRDHRHGHTPRSVPGGSAMNCSGENMISPSFFSRESWVFKLRSPDKFFSL